MVTWAHCAQQISGNMFPDMLLTKDMFISINMPIFMVASGFVINIDKMRNATIKEYIFSRFLRLIVPMTTWYIAFSAAIYPRHVGYWDAYWYLSALFVCLVLIKLLSYVISSNLLLCLSSIVILSLLPFPFFERSCFMIPFLWVGYGLRKVIDRVDWRMVLLLMVVYAVLYYFWDVKRSIYLSPFLASDINAGSLDNLLYRFVIGAVGGAAFLGMLRLLEQSACFKRLFSLSKYGRYTLVFYTMSFVLNAILARFMWHIDFFITTPGILDLTAFLISVQFMVVMYYFQVIIEKNRVLSRLFLGE